MKPIVTLTMNPTIDGASEAEAVRPTRKIRTTGERYDPGGGGINVARVVVELGGPALPVYLAGGATGAVLDELLAARGFRPRRIGIRDHTRISHSVHERSTGLEFRFVPEGPLVRDDEWTPVLAALTEMDFDYCVASGSLPRGVPDDFYVEVARIVARKGGRLVLDASGAALKAAIGSAALHLVKPSLGEFEALTGRELGDERAQEEEALALVKSGAVDMLAVSLGHHGALLATQAGVSRLRPPDVKAKSTVGAGDSFVGGMTFGLAGGRSPPDAFMLGVAAGTAAVLTPGTELCRREDIWRLYEALRSRR